MRPPARVLTQALLDLEYLPLEGGRKQKSSGETEEPDKYSPV